MEGLREHFFPGARLAEHQHRCRCRRHLLDLREHLARRLAVGSEHPGALQRPHLAPQLHVLQRQLILQPADLGERVLQELTIPPVDEAVRKDRGGQLQPVERER